MNNIPAGDLNLLSTVGKRIIRCLCLGKTLCYRQEWLIVIRFSTCSYPNPFQFQTNVSSHSSQAQSLENRGNYDYIETGGWALGFPARQAKGGGGIQARASTPFPPNSLPYLSPLPCPTSPRKKIINSPLSSILIFK